MRQYQKFGLVPILLVSLVGCGKADQTANNGRTNEPLSVGYYSNENHENNGGNAILLDGADNDGPITEMMDHSLGAERNSNQRFLRVRNQNNNQVNDGNRQNYYNGNMNDRVTQLVGKIENVKEAKTVIQGNNVIVGVRLNDKRREGETIKNIKQAVQAQLSGKKLYLITNDRQFNQLKSIDNDLRNGGPNDELNLEINKLIQMNNSNR